MNYYGDSGAGITDPDTLSFDHPLNAEVHELKIYDRYRTDDEISAAMKNGFESLQTEIDSGLLFYVPPFFVKDSPVRHVLQTPFQTAVGSTDDPFNVPLSFGVGGHYLNLPNRPPVHISSGTLEEREPVTTEEIAQVGPSPIGEEYYDFGDPL